MWSYSLFAFITKISIVGETNDTYTSSLKKAPLLSSDRVYEKSYWRKKWKPYVIWRKLEFQRSSSDFKNSSILTINTFNSCSLQLYPPLLNILSQLLLKTATKTLLQPNCYKFKFWHKFVLLVIDFKLPLWEHLLSDLRGCSTNFVQSLD